MGKRLTEGQHRVKAMGYGLELRRKAIRKAKRKSAKKKSGSTSETGAEPNASQP